MDGELTARIEDRDLAHVLQRVGGQELAERLRGGHPIGEAIERVGPSLGSTTDCVATAPTPARAHAHSEPTLNQCDWTATPSSPVAGSRATDRIRPMAHPDNLKGPGPVKKHTEAVLARVRDTPEGFVRSYGDVSPGAPRFAGTVLYRTDEDVRGGGSSPTARSRRAPASGRCWRRRRACRSRARRWTCGRPGYRNHAMWIQREVTLRERARGFHLITRDVLEAVPELQRLRVGLLHVFIRHTSASLTLNKNASPDVRDDFESHFNATVPEDARYWTHTIEGPDDMPAHIKASLFGPSLTLPVSGGRLATGTWQGIYLCEHRDHGGSRSLVLTLNGE